MDDSRGLYLLSILLTADRENAELCFNIIPYVCIGGNSASHKWMIVRNAVRMLTPNPGPCESESTAAFAATSLQEPFLARVLALDDFERLVYVLSVLEEYADQNCADLLGVSPQRIRDTRNCALKHIGHLDS